MSKVSKKYLVASLSILILLSFTGIALARGGRNSRWTRKNPKPTPTVTITASPTSRPTLSPTMTPKPTIIATVKPSPLPTQAPTSQPSATNLIVYVTYYGWPDNDPAGTAIAYPKEDEYPTIHNGAGGTGTYDNPVTFAAKVGKFPIGTKIYVPYIKKYIILEDTCASCTGNWIDIWMESDGQFKDNVIKCEEHWTKENIPVEVNPLPNREVSTLPLFDKSTGVCRN